MSETRTSPLLTKPVLAFLGITFALTWGIESALIVGGMEFTPQAELSTPGMWLLAFMWIPGLAALLVTRFMEGQTFSEIRTSLGLSVGSSNWPYLITILIIPLCFAAIYAVSWNLGLTDLVETGKSEIDPTYLVQIVLPISIVLGPIINLFFGLGEELGWRGFLLPRLMVLGKAKAYTILGVIWALWHAPLIFAGFNYPGYPLIGIVMMCVVSVGFGIFMNEMTLRYRSSILPGFIHGAFNAQSQGVWIWLFPATHPLLGGAFGLVGAVCWFVLGLATIAVISRLKRI